ncbi:ABC transporter ATP-binding protein [Bosea sp. (in: a-proteobacteria)]|jgi:iron(III) transport system ATP-binding protein|uniref:ABC transporter ATP-binding protein n=1 Tax=Bosea sp. (in: a-proteobacteria) TaxID=1871050 RepID=UPI002DDD29A9|nr:ABC transporter ATP-binding protein [Bosea sp. (in: a-proteobacteria)]HEV2512067.1 ABC transporter ATP-binding protein [Bosea sp. (in: a-proteobacteria)]
MLVIENLVKSYPGQHGQDEVQALRDVSFKVDEGAIFTLLGPSGCGKTTTLQCIAGLENPDSGAIRMGDRAVFSSRESVLVPANRRELGMVFQSYAIWPHMSVFDNVAFPLVHGVKRVPSREVRPRVQKALEMVELGHLADRPAPLLSGGQQQRVALARALAHEPRLLLLDEPLSNLDAKLRDTMRTEIRSLVKSLGITTIFVTHDQVEAIGMSDQIVLMKAGKIVQQGSPRDIYLKPNSVFTADFMGRSNLLPGVLENGGATARAQTAIGPVSGIAGSELAPGEQVMVVVRPQAIVIAPDTDPAQGSNRFKARVDAMTFLGDVVETEVETGGRKLTLMLDPYTSLVVGQKLILELPPERCVIVPAAKPPSGRNPQ